MIFVEVPSRASQVKQPPTRPWEKLKPDIKNNTCTDIILNRPNPIREPRTYIVGINGKVYYRTREHLRPRSNNMPGEVNEHFE